MAPPTWTRTLDTLYTTCWNLRRKTLTDQIFQATPFWYYLNKKGKIVERGGLYIEDPIRYGTNTSVTSISKGDTVTLVDSDPATIGVWPWKYVTGHIVRNFQDDQQNRGEGQFKDLVQVKIDVLRDRYAEKMEEYLFGDGTGNGGRDPNGLLNLVPYVPTSGICGGLNRATYTWWRNGTTNMTGENPSVWLRRRMLTAYNTASTWGAGEGLDAAPDCIITTQAIHELYDMEMDEISQIIVKDNMPAGRGFGALAWKGIPLNWSPKCPNYAMWMLNLSHLKLTVDNIENFTLGEWIPLANQPGARVAHAMFVCNLTISKCRTQSVIYNIDN